MRNIPDDITDVATTICASVGITDSHARKVFAAAILAERRRCAAAVLAEKLAGPTVDPTDISYDLAIEHAHDAIWRAS